MKGGVGKTTVALSLAEGSAALKKKHVLLIDLDPQINASVLLSGHIAASNLPWRIGATVLEYLDHRANGRGAPSDDFVLRDLLELSPSNTISLLSGHFDLRAFERRLLVRRQQTVLTALKFMRDSIDAILAEQGPLYDLIVFDCPPGFSLITEAAIAAAHTVIVPTAPNHLGMQGLFAFFKYLEDDLEISELAERTHVFLTLTRGTSTSQEFERSVRQEAKSLSPRYSVFRSSYPLLDGFQRAMDRRQKRMRVLGAVSRTLNRLRHRTLFDRLYDGVGDHVASFVNEVWASETRGVEFDDRSRPSPSTGGSRQPAARP